MFRPVRRAAFFDLAHPERPPHEDVALQAALEGHRAKGDLVVMVVDSLRPFPRTLPAEGILLRLSPSATRDMDKCTTVVEAMARLCIDPVSCFGYGDLCTGTGLLGVVGNPRVIACSADSRRLAQELSWPVIMTPSTV
ncbi:hypothetical protein OG204_35285 (plasmid) [Streptomyces sp. NBC_01387]|uniref:hypothetical protein n=1 Tax=unclassified Streptomyces TaxID=2593676 RepID=UPI002023FA22|nr:MULTISPECIES: hypothetical protein [unclassified Streptomyces]MCX4554481.1 hypothetical protein [Streptomyces sp. NBC_01500]WSC25135.1 hypothetical protein OIE60_36425 [Streptomyces sp. NBC_01766]WSV58984.1 hypothetical protein OG282_35385 [Streptomyces sp. NBC_01014]